VRLIPYERLVLHTESPPEVVTSRLATMVAVRWFYVGQPLEPFRGSIQGTHFKITRDLGLLWRNSWRPVVLGDIAAGPAGTEVRLRFRLSVLAGTFTAAWFGALLVGAAAMARNGLREGGGLTSGLLVLAVMGIPAYLSYLLTSLSFWEEVTKARTLLSNGLGCSESKVMKRPVDHDRR
jgi:hypothetical protein